VTRPVALVTGASAGIGRAFSVALAARGHDLVLVARDRTRLSELAGRLADDHGVDAEVIAADLTDREARQDVVDRLKDARRPVDLLVNNAGFGRRGRFWSLPRPLQLELVELNVVALVELAHAALGPMVDRGHGGVINVSSLAGAQPVPGSALYGASKSFVDNFTQAVHEELRGTGVRVMLLAPGFTSTEFREHVVGADRLPKWAWGTADDCVADALRAFDSGHLVCHPRAVNAVVAVLSDITPTAVTRRVAGLLTRYRDR
jgi:uncharacterized protein